MRCRPAPVSRILVALAALGLGIAVARADEEPEDPAPVGGEVRALDDDEARKVVRQIASLSRKRDATPLVQALEALGPVSHGDLHKPLLRLLDHDDARAALLAADLLGCQQLEKDRERDTLARAVWKEGWSARANAARNEVRGRALRAHARLTGDVVDERAFREVRGLWEGLIAEPREDLGPGMVELCRYAREAKDKRLCRLLAEEIDQPLATDVDSPDNPPGEWWERRWLMWRVYHAEAVEALEAITGQHFKTTAEAKAWFEANAETFGFRW